MNWEAIGAVGEMVGVVAVVATLFYLSTQIRQSNRATQSESIQEASTAFNELNILIAADESLAKIYRVGIKDLSALSEDERERFSFFMLATFHVFETLFFQNRFGTIDPEFWEAEKRSLRTLVGMKGGREWWLANPFSFTDAFLEFVSVEIENAT